MTADLSALIAKLEAAEGGNAALDGQIYNHLGCDLIRPTMRQAPAQRRWPDKSITVQRKLTTSLDAALALAERVLPGWVWQLRIDKDQAEAQCDDLWWGEGYEAPDVGGTLANGSTPALALCIAILKAHASRAVEGGK